MVLATKPKRQAAHHHRKRTGDHHKRTKAYHKSYWPYLPMLAVVAIGFAINMVWAPHSGGVLAYATNVSIDSLLDETNDERSAAGQGTLTINQQLMAAAQAKANDMVSRNYWSHITPDGKQPWWFVTNAGYEYQATGENLAYGFDSSDATVSGWMNSPSHKANLLNGVYQDVGFGVANSNDYQGFGPQTVIVALYGKVLSNTQAAVSPPAPAPAPAPTAIAPAAPAPVAAPAPAAAPIVQPTPPVAPPATAKAPVAAAASTTASQPVSRLELMASGISPISVVITTAIVAIASAIFILRHMVFWHRAFVKGEKFMVKHWKADLLILSLIVVGVLVTRTVGYIQ